MTVLVPVAIVFWIFFTIFLFFRYDPRNAVLISVFGGILLLPVTSFNFPGLPEFSKEFIIAFSLVLGETLSGSRRKYYLVLTGFDVPMMLWCFASPVLSALFNNIGLYNGLSEMLMNFFSWGIFFWVGRRYFSDLSSIKKITWAFIIGGIVYIFFILWELRMSPRLHSTVYGYFAADWRQHFRYGGYRPIVFMNHGIMVAVFMAATTTIAFWLWRDKKIEKIKNIRVSFIVLVLIVVTIFCRTAAAWVYLILGIIIYIQHKKNRSTGIIRILILIVPLYIFVRVTGLISSESVLAFVSRVFDEERVQSLSVRLIQEDLFSARAFLRPVFGWGGMSRAWPVDYLTGRRLIAMIDPLWVILFGRYGLFGLISVFASLGLGPWLVSGVYRCRGRNKTSAEVISAEVMVLCLIAVLFMIDSIINAMVNPMYIMVSGALLSHYLEKKRQYKLERDVE